MTKLEDNPMTFPEVKTDVEGISVAGRRISDLEQVVRISRGWKEISEQVNWRTFIVNKENCLKLNEIIFKDEAFEVGQFRIGNVRISGTHYTPPVADELAHAFNQLLLEYNVSINEAKKTHNLFLNVTRNQFF